MARGTQHRKRRPRPTASAVAQPAPPPKQPKVKHAAWEEQLFFSRLRVHAKWMFLLLAIAFAGGFIFFGVGSGSTGISDLMQNFFSSSSSGSSLGSLQNKAKSHPKDPTAWRNLATKLEQDKKQDRAIVALQHYTKLAPKDESSLEELANLYVQRASDYYQLYASLAAQSQLVSSSSDFRPPSASPFNKALTGQDPFLTDQSTLVNNRESAALQRPSTMNAQSETAYKKLAKLSPENATYQFQLATVADNLSDYKTAIAGYKAFLKLAPSDALAPRAKAALERVEKAQAASAAATQKSTGH